MKKHPLVVPHYEGELAALAHHVNAMRYDLVIEFYQHSVAELRRQAAGDRARGRMKLASSLEDAAADLDRVIESIECVWRICEPYMKDEMEQ